MSHTLKKLEKSQVELEITVAPTDYNELLIKASVRLSERAAIKGFRPGKAPYDIVKEQLGDIKIFEEAMQSIVEKFFYQAVQAEKLQTIGMPQITIQKLAPGNDFVFKAVVAQLPIIKLGDLTKIKVSKNTKKVEDKEMNDVLENLRKMQTKEVLKNGIAEKKDKVVIKMEMFNDKVPVEGGQANKHAVYLSEQHYIPGLQEHLVGLKKDDTKEFTLKFPDAHYQKHLAGKNIDFKIFVNDVYELQYPELNDDFAKALGQENMDKLKEILLQNLTKEAEQKEEQRVEAEILDALVAGSDFGDIPDVLINSEKQKIFHELKHNLEKYGIEMEKYLADLKKTEKQIFDDFAEQATKRVKAGLVSRQIALDNNLQAEPTEIDQEIELVKKAYPNDKTVEENVKRPEVRETIAVAVQNRKVMRWLKNKIMTNS